MTRPSLFLLLLTAACNTDRPQCHQLDTDASAVAVTCTCGAGRVARVIVFGAKTCIVCEAKGDR